MGPRPRGPITPRPGTQARRIHLGPQQGTPQIFARVQASMEKQRAQQLLQGSRGQQEEERWEEQLVPMAVAAIRRPSRLRLRVETCGPSRSTGSP